MGQSQQRQYRSFELQNEQRSPTAKEFFSQNDQPASLSDSSIYSFEWMKHLHDRTLLSLTLPTSHNAATYHTKNYIWMVKGYMACQNTTIYQQLMMGVRALDLRVCGFQRNKPNSPVELWCAHTFLSVPLSVVINDVRKFIKRNPSEVVILKFRQDCNSLNADQYGLAKYRNKSQVIRVDILQTIEVVRSWLASKDVKIYDQMIDVDTKLKDILDTDSNIVVCNGEELYPLNPDINYQHSWGDTLHWKPEMNVRKCKQWCEDRQDRHKTLINLTIQVTLENMPWSAWIDEILFTKQGLQSHAYHSNQHLEEWLDHQEERELLKNVFFLNIDFAYEKLCRKIYLLNFDNALNQAS